LPHWARAALMAGESLMASKPLARGVHVLSARGMAIARIASRARKLLPREKDHMFEFLAASGSRQKMFVY
jgi:hypothetical protein